MKLVIEIDDEYYTTITNKVKVIRDEASKNGYANNDVVPIGWVSIANGTPLPKGHGDLVDFDRLCEEYWDGNYMEIHKDDLSNIKPIIEADGGGEDAD